MLSSSVCRWDVDMLPELLGGSEHAVQFGSLLCHPALFDASAFAIPPSEATLLDPQQRQLLVSAADTLHHAGGAAQAAQWGVWVGASSADYGRTLAQVCKGGALTAYNATAGTLSVISGRLSYTFGLQGPAVTCDTAW